MNNNNNQDGIEIEAEVLGPDVLETPTPEAQPRTKPPEIVFEDPKTILSSRTLLAEVDKVLLLADRGVVKTVCAVVLANKMKLDPAWLFLVAPSSGGKTELVTAIEDLVFVHPIDTLTVNTFASGQTRQGKETSLLLKIKNGVITMKDFTSILEMNEMARREIMSQLRAIFDGEYVKRTGTGDDIKWRGKIGLIAAVTSIIHDRAAEFASMGERFIIYQIKQPDRKEVQRRVFQNAHGMNLKRAHIKTCFKNYLEYATLKLTNIDIELSNELKEEFIDIADLCTMARTGLVKDKRDSSKIVFVPDAEMPTRVLSQLYTIASAFIAINTIDRINDDQAPEYDITQEDKDLIYKIALDSIPRKRRQALQVLAKYEKGVTSAGIAIALKYDTKVMKETLFELNALGFISRKRNGGTDLWTLEDTYKETIRKFEKIEPLYEVLEAGDEVEDYSEIIDESNNRFSDDF